MSIPEAEVVLESPIRLITCFRLHRFGGLDPSFRLDEGALLQAVHTLEGPAVLEIKALDPGPSSARFRARGHGPGGRLLVERAPAILGVGDRPDAFVPACTPTRRLVRRVFGLRLTQAVSPHGMLINLIFQQRVAWRDAARAYRKLVDAHGTPAPGDFGLTLPPAPRVWSRVPFAEYSALQMDRRRAETVRRVAEVASRIDAWPAHDVDAIVRKLSSVPGVGPWTVQNYLGFVLGYPDALPLGDYDLPHRVATLFHGRARSNDEEMVTTLEPYRGQRWRIVRLMEESGARFVRFAPRRRSGPRR